MLRLSVWQVRERTDKGEIPCRRRGSERRYPAAEILALASTTGSASSSPGKIDAQALRLMSDGKRDDEIVMLLEIPLERVEALRACRGERASSTMLSASAAAAAQGDDDDERELAAAEASAARRHHQTMTRIRERRAKIRGLFT